MTLCRRVCAMVVIVLTALSLGYAEEVDLRQALQRGEVWVQFRAGVRTRYGGRSADQLTAPRSCQLDQVRSFRRSGEECRA